MHPSDQSLQNCHYNKASLLLSPPCQELLWFSPGFHRLLIAAPPCSSGFLLRVLTRLAVSGLVSIPVGLPLSEF